MGAEEHLHLGQKVAQFFRGFGLADEAVITIISAMPVVELRGAIPVGIWMGLPMAKVFALCVLGNMIPIAPLLYALRFGPVQKVMKPILTRAQSKAEAAFADPKSRAVLWRPCGHPLPGTGAWTGAMGAFLLGMPFAQAFTAIFAGVLCSGCIMTAISRGGKFGIAVGVLLLGSMLTQVSGNGRRRRSPAAAGKRETAETRVVHGAWSSLQEKQGREDDGGGGGERERGGGGARETETENEQTRRQERRLVVAFHLCSRCYCCSDGASYERIIVELRARFLPPGGVAASKS